MRLPRNFLLCAVALFLTACPGRSILGTDSGGSDATNESSVDSTASDAFDSGVAPDASDTVDATFTDASDASDTIDAAVNDANDSGDTVNALDASDAMEETDSTSVGDATAVDVDGDAAIVWQPIGDGGCNARQRAVPIQTALHVDPDAGPIEWWSDPPASGPHYPSWARWGEWVDLPTGYWVHNLEHGGIAMLYRCPSGACTATAAALRAVVDTIPTDPVCMPSDAAPARVRVVITNHNTLDTPIAAAAWGYLYAADCVDADSLRAFYVAHAGMAPEDFCGDGSYP